MPRIAVPAKRGLGETCAGIALIANVPFSARYDLDRVVGRVSRPGHPLDGANVAGRILIFPSVQGGVAGGWAFLAMARRGVGPAGLVFGAINPVIVQGAVAAGLPLLAGIDDSVFQLIRSGDEVELDPGVPQLVMLRRGSYVASGFDYDITSG